MYDRFAELRSQYMEACKVGESEREDAQPKKNLTSVARAACSFAHLDALLGRVSERGRTSPVNERAAASL